MNSSITPGNASPNAARSIPTKTTAIIMSMTKATANVLIPRNQSILYQYFASRMNTYIDQPENERLGPAFLSYILHAY